MKLVFEYIKTHYKSVAMFAAFAAVFAVVSALSKVPFDVVGYCVLLCGFIGLIVFAVSFSRFVRRHRQMLLMQNYVNVSLDGLPEPRTLLERDYTELLEQLFDAKLKAESDKAKTVSEMNDYYTLWAHQIKTPIAAMHLLLQSGQAQTDELDGQLFKIEQYVEMVLTYLRCDTGMSDYVLRQHELDPIVRAAVRKYAKQFIHKKITLNYEPVELSAVTDDKWLSFVIEQLLSNSLKYTRKGSITVCSENGNTLAIRDTGIGIAAEDLPRVCERGYTGYNGREEKKSTGIGLYLCKRILDGLGHGMSLESEEGKGTTVRIHFSVQKHTYE